MSAKFSVIIPTQDRPQLLRLVVEAALQSKNVDVKIVVSDNSTSLDFRDENTSLMRPFIESGRVRLVRPPQILAAPEHFEFALSFATEDYVAFLTDKMILLPSTLSKAAQSFNGSDAQIINWSYRTFAFLEMESPGGPISLHHDPNRGAFEASFYDPLDALRFKSNVCVNRTRQKAPDYVLGKIIFGCYRSDLISQILMTSGTLFGGATHDYSAMVQALSIAKKCITLNEPGILFASLPLNASLGSLTYYSAPEAFRYYQTFRDPVHILNHLMVPGLWASQHNMVAHDYIKFLGIYGRSQYFNERKWLEIVHQDLTMRSRVWADREEERLQLEMFRNFLRANGIRWNFPAASWWRRQKIHAYGTSKGVARGVLSKIQRLSAKTTRGASPTYESLEAALKTF